MESLPTPTALRPRAQGWPRNEAYPGFDPNAGPNRIAVVATSKSTSKRRSGATPQRGTPRQPRATPWVAAPYTDPSPERAAYPTHHLDPEPPSPRTNHEVHQRHEVQQHQIPPTAPLRVLDHPREPYWPQSQEERTAARIARRRKRNQPLEVPSPHCASASLRETSPFPPEARHLVLAHNRWGAVGAKRITAAFFEALRLRGFAYPFRPRKGIGSMRWLVDVNLSPLIPRAGSIP
jgi:hypothetical protein